MSSRKRPRLPAPPSKRRSAADPDAMIARAAWMQVGLGRRLGHDDEKIRADIKAAIAEAMEGDAPYRQAIDTMEGPLDCVSSAGVFRLVLDNFGLDRSDQWKQERWIGVDERAVAEALARSAAG